MVCVVDSPVWTDVVTSYWATVSVQSESLRLLICGKIVRYLNERITYDRLRKIKVGGELGTGYICWAVGKPGVEKRRGRPETREPLRRVLSVRSLCGGCAQRGPWNYVASVFHSRL